MIFDKLKDFFGEGWIMLFDDCWLSNGYVMLKVSPGLIPSDLVGKRIWVEYECSFNACRYYRCEGCVRNCGRCERRCSRRGNNSDPDECGLSKRLESVRQISGSLMKGMKRILNRNSSEKIEIVSMEEEVSSNHPEIKGVKFSNKIVVDNKYYQLIASFYPDQNLEYFYHRTSHAIYFQTSKGERVAVLMPLRT